MTALAVAFLGTAALWWLYFDYVANIAQRRLALAPNRTVLARDGYTYLHVADGRGRDPVRGRRRARDRASDRPALRAAQMLAVVGGPAIYLLGHALFRLRMAGSVSWKRLGGRVACVSPRLRRHVDVRLSRSARSSSVRSSA